MSESLVIPAEFNEPIESGNGGYSAGAVAAFLDGMGLGPIFGGMG